MGYLVHNERAESEVRRIGESNELREEDQELLPGLKQDMKTPKSVGLLPVLPPNPPPKNDRTDRQTSCGSGRERPERPHRVGRRSKHHPGH